MLEINPGLILWTAISFLVLLIILKKFAWKPLLGALEEREEHIRVSIENAEHARKESERLLEEHKKQIARAEEQARSILNEGRELAEKLKSEIVEKAQTQSRTMIEQAKQEIERDKEAALQQLRGEVADLAVLAAGKILNETLDVNRHRKLVDDVIKTFPKN